MKDSFNDEKFAKGNRSSVLELEIIKEYFAYEWVYEYEYISM